MSEPTLRRGSKGDAVARLQEALTAAGFDTGGADGTFGAGTEAAVKAFQTAHGLTSDGIAGAGTWGALGSGGTAGPGGLSQPGYGFGIIHSLISVWKLIPIEWPFLKV